VVQVALVDSEVLAAWAAWEAWVELQVQLEQLELLQGKV
jgi:hypothetical protein